MWTKNKGYCHYFSWCGQRLHSSMQPEKKNFPFILVQLFCIFIHGQLESVRNTAYLLVSVWISSLVGVANYHTSGVRYDKSMFYYVKATLEMLCLGNRGKCTTGAKGETKLHRDTLRSVCYV